MNRPLDTLMKKEMDRKEFLVTVGFSVAALLGLSAILELLGKGSGSSAQLPTNTGPGYGSNSYDNHNRT